MGEMIVFGIKMAAVIAVSLVFMSAIMAIINLIVSVVFANVIGEVFAIISMCLPFDASVVFGGLGTMIAAILAFLVAQKLWQLTGSIFDATK